MISNLSAILREFVFGGSMDNEKFEKAGQLVIQQAAMRLNVDEKLLSTGSYDHLNMIWRHRSTNAAIYVGDHFIAADEGQLLCKNIKAIVNCTRPTSKLRGELPNYLCDSRHKFAYYDFPIANWPDFIEASITSKSILGFFMKMFRFVERAVNRGESVLVHCLAGAHRAGTTGVALLMYFAELSRKEAIAAAKLCRPVIDPIGHLPECLKLLEKDLKGRRRVPDILPPIPQLSRHNSRSDLTSSTAVGGGNQASSTLNSARTNPSPRPSLTISPADANSSGGATTTMTTTIGVPPGALVRTSSRTQLFGASSRQSSSSNLLDSNSNTERGGYSDSSGHGEGREAIGRLSRSSSKNDLTNRSSFGSQNIVTSSFGSNSRPPSATLQRSKSHSSLQPIGGGGASSSTQEDVTNAGPSRMPTVRETSCRQKEASTTEDSNSMDRSPRKSFSSMLLSGVSSLISSHKTAKAPDPIPAKLAAKPSLKASRDQRASFHANTSFSSLSEAGNSKSKLLPPIQHSLPPITNASSSSRKRQRLAGVDRLFTIESSEVEKPDERRSYSHVSAFGSNADHHYPQLTTATVVGKSEVPDHHHPRTRLQKQVSVTSLSTESQTGSSDNNNNNNNSLFKPSPNGHDLRDAWLRRAQSFK